MSKQFKLPAAAYVEALLYTGSFPLNFLNADETVSALVGDGACQIESVNQVVDVEVGQLVLRGINDRLYVASEVDE